MSSVDYTTDALIDKVKRYAAVPEYQPAFSSDDMLDFLNEELELAMVPFIKDCDEDFFVRYEDFTLPANETTPLRLDGRISGLSMREVKLVDSSTGNLDTMQNMTRAEFDNMGRYRRSGNMFYLQGNNLYVMNPSQNSGKEVRVYYYDRPNRLVVTTEVGTITAIDTGTNTVTVNAVPADFTTSLEYDLVQATPHFDVYEIEQTATAIVGADITFGSLPTGLAVGDYVCKSGFAPVPNIPMELHNLLAMGASVRILEALGDENGLVICQRRYNSYKNDARRLIAPRVKGEKQIINNLGGFL